MKILFLCTGNYYRSRFAEELVNHFAPTLNLSVCAYSLGLARNITALRNSGPMSPHTKKRLAEMGIAPLRDTEFPKEFVADDFVKYDRVIALSVDEHQPMVNEYFPELTDKIEFWGVEDVHLWRPKKALDLIIQQVEKLLVSLGANRNFKII